MEATQRKPEIRSADASIQDNFLNAARKDRLIVTIFLVSGVKLTGRIRSFDKYAVILESGNQEQLIYKHAISTVVSQRMHGHGPHAPAPAATQPAVPAAPSSPAPERPPQDGPQEA